VSRTKLSVSNFKDKGKSIAIVDACPSLTIQLSKWASQHFQNFNSKEKGKRPIDDRTRPLDSNGCWTCDHSNLAQPACGKWSFYRNCHRNDHVAHHCNSQWNKISKNKAKIVEVVSIAQ
jgi:hypothetical protein